MTVKELQIFHGRIKNLKYEVSKEKSPAIAKKTLRSQAESISTEWFQSIASDLAHQPALSAETIEEYSAYFAHLLKLSRPNNLKKSYLTTLSAILRNFHDALILPVQMQPKIAKEVSLLGKVFVDLAAPEDQYMQEAIACASHGLHRGAAVLGWCATIDRIHRVIDTIGITKFNNTSLAMKEATSGRFKKFNKIYNVQSLSELREVFDTDILWILEGLQLIDGNQHTRLRSCFELRCQCAHPGEAPVTEYNLLSFFSDINEIVFKNAKFGKANT